MTFTGTNDLLWYQRPLLVPVIFTGTFTGVKRELKEANMYMMLC